MPFLPSYATEEDLARLIDDTNRFGTGNRLNYFNGIRALRGPDGTDRVDVAGPSGEGGDIKFYKGSELLLQREVKGLVPSGKNLTTQMSNAAEEIGYNGDIWIQIHGPEYQNPGAFGEQQFQLRRRIRGFQMVDKRDLSKYARVRITIFDTQGRLYVYNYPLGHLLSP
jgi:hypothetical protein